MIGWRDLPPPPVGRTGWPWTEEGGAPPARRADDSAWPRFSIVTPSYNQGAYLEETLRSVLLQGYPNLEYVVMDGGSSDGSVEILRRYAPFLSDWRSEKDGGQSQAINRGLARATGELLGWVNSDDRFEPGALACAAQALSGTGAWTVGHCREIDAQGRLIRLIAPQLIRTPAEWAERFLDSASAIIPQPSTFWTAAAWKRAGPLREDMHFVFDHDFFFRLLRAAGPPALVAQTLSSSRLHPDCKNVAFSNSFAPELIEAGLRNLGAVPFHRRLWAPVRVSRSRGTLALYEGVRLARQGDRRGAAVQWLKAFALWPFGFASRLFAGFVRREILKWR